MIFERNIHGFRYILINDKTVFIDGIKADTMFIDPMYSKITSQIPLYKNWLKVYNPDSMFHFTYNAAQYSNDRNAHPDNIEKFLANTCYTSYLSFSRRATWTVWKYDYNLQLPFGKKSHSRYNPPNDSDVIIRFTHQKTKAPDYWEISNLEKSSILNRYVQIETEYDENRFHCGNAFKPVRLYFDFITSYSRENSWIVDMDACSGNSLKAAIMAKRNYIGYETDPIFFQKLVETLKSFELNPPVAPENFFQ